MKRTFKYDVAISAVDFDGLAAAELQRRLEQRLRLPVYSTVQPSDAVRSPEASEAVTRILERDARLVVVLHQRLWGDTPATEVDATAVRARVAELGRKSVHVVPLDTAGFPAWLKGGAKSKPVGATSALVDQIVAAVSAAGGTPRPDTDETAAARLAVDERRARDRATFLGSQRAVTMVSRELDALSAAVTRCCGEPGALPEGVVPSVRRTPDRYTVQIGPVGLSFSWIRGRSNSIADGQLLVIEWSGRLGDQPADVGRATNAMPAFEHVLQPNATAPDNWQWRRTDLDFCAYTTRDLAAQCVASVLSRIPVETE
jgi:hypothetical protein